MLKSNKTLSTTSMPPMASQGAGRLLKIFSTNIFFSKILLMMERIKRMDLPQEIFIIMITIVGFASDGLQLEDRAFVEQTQVHYMNLLHR